MFENKSYTNIKTSTERSFGIVFTFVFGIIALYPKLYDGNIREWAFAISLFFLFFGLFLPKVLYWPNRLWFKLGMFLGAIVAPIIMLLLFFLTYTPTGIIMRLLGKDLLNQKLDKSKDSYWIRKETIMTSMKNQF